MVVGHFWASAALWCAVVHAALPSGQCKATPGSASWPSQEQWTALNGLVEGRLLAPSPAAAPCHREFPEFDEAQCQYVKSRWNSSQWHSDQPNSALFQNVNLYACVPNSEQSCSPQAFPIYVINATVAEDVVAGVNFARDNNVRLNIKSTGHDFAGRSAQPNSLSIWTHYLRAMEWFDTQYPLRGCGVSVPGSVVRAGSGTQWRELYRAAADRDLMLVGGSSSTVSLGGYMSGGGHSNLSPYLGMGVDSVVEMEVVTANGEFITVNECSNPDLFWAMRGGGGSTFGVVVSFSIQAFPTVPVASWAGSLLGNGTIEDKWNALAFVHAEWPKQLSPYGISGHYIGSPGQGYGTFVVNMPNATSNATLTRVLEPIVAGVSNATGGRIRLSGIARHHASWGHWMFPSKPVPGAKAVDDSTSYYGSGGSKLITNWLWDEKALSSPDMKQALRNSLDNQTVLWNLFTAGPGTHRGPIRGGSNAVSPAWRKAYLRATVAMQGPPWSVEKLKERKARLKAAGEVLRQHAPYSGAYGNEADPDMDDINRAFYGSNYERLLSIKKSVDPQGVFWCKACVGFEEWEDKDGALCRP